LANVIKLIGIKRVVLATAVENPKALRSKIFQRLCLVDIIVNVAQLFGKQQHQRLMYMIIESAWVAIRTASSVTSSYTRSPQGRVSERL